jgi:hypothetical protein
VQRATFFIYVDRDQSFEVILVCDQVENLKALANREDGEMTSCVELCNCILDDTLGRDIVRVLLARFFVNKY